MHVGLVAAALLGSSMWLLGLPVNEVLLAAGATGAFLVYTVDRHVGRRPEDALNRERMAPLEPWEQWLQRGLGVVMTVGLVAVVYSVVGGGAVGGASVASPAGPVLPGRVWLAGAVAGAAGLWYALPVRWNLKHLLGRARSPAIAGVWGAGVVLLPAMAVSEPAAIVPWTLIVLFAAYRTLYLLPNVLAAEFVDRPGDQLAEIPGLTANWTRSRLSQVSAAAAVAALAVGAGLTLLLAQQGSGGQQGVGGYWNVPVASLWLALDLAGLGGQVWLTRPRARLDHSRVFHLDLLAAWPVVPAALLWT